MELALLPGRLSIFRLPADTAFPEWALRAEPLWLTRTADELSIVAPDEAAPPDPGLTAERGWCGLRVRGPLDFALTGILAALCVPLAEAGVPIFALSTYDTDYLLVPEARLDDALGALRAAGHTIA